MNGPYVHFRAGGSLKYLGGCKRPRSKSAWALSLATILLNLRNFEGASGLPASPPSFDGPASKNHHVITYLTIQSTHSTNDFLVNEQLLQSFMFSLFRQSVSSVIHTIKPFIFWRLAFFGNNSKNPKKRTNNTYEFGVHSIKNPQLHYHKLVSACCRCNFK